MVPNKSLIFSAVPTHAPIPGEHITLEDRPFDLSARPPQHGITGRTLWISLDPYMRGRMRPASTASYSPAYTLGAPLTAYALVQVLSSDTDIFHPGDIVYGQFPVAEYSAITREMLDRPVVRKVYALEGLPAPLAPLSPWLSVLGSTGLTAYASLYKIGVPKRGETIFVSSAAGAVGLFVGQIARIEGLTVIGSVGDDEKLRFIRESGGFHDGFNYKKERTAEALKRLAPSGVDIYYDNVGGEQLEAALEAMNEFGRIVVCGMISQYNKPAAEQYAVRGLTNVLSKRLKIQGFVVTDPEFFKYREERDEKMIQWLKEGKLKNIEHVTEGIENAAEAFVAMLEGSKAFGKALLKVADPE
ncbi:hypothetical protein A1O7_02993 [Cladophialophora yegresii CBS 114405]|uniref:Enoyl reductase (ER) domain-containing protein n=1 Tax=Cladophialophora yegresii CBS 114405 TaxID=1182544 RepID=W9WC43_9EURO|nr:uncharacterized protein A1O7_02993 [Cladophialophora yegresii CBS 114405]EXJ62555.1 hypothetical protein A1O7_02993 [Cladophialophora yegresii CBS 114405]